MDIPEERKAQKHLPEEKSATAGFEAQEQDGENGGWHEYGEAYYEEEVYKEEPGKEKRGELLLPEHREETKEENIEKKEDTKIEKEDTLRWLDLLYGVLFQPGSTFAALAAGRELRQGLTVFILVQFFNLYLQVVLTGKDLLLRSPQGLPFWLAPEQMAHLAAVGGAVVVLLGMLASCVGLFVGAGVYNLTAELLGGKGNGRGVLVGHSLAVLPVVLGFPVRYVVHLFSLPVVIMSLVSFLLWIWVVVLKIMVLQRSCSLSQGRAAAAYFLPWLVLMVAVILVVGGSLAALAPL